MGSLLRIPAPATFVVPAHQMDIQVQRTAKTLNQRDRAGVGGRDLVTCFVGQVCLDGAVDDTQCLAHDLRLAGTSRSEQPGDRYEKTYEKYGEITHY